MKTYQERLRLKHKKLLATMDLAGPEITKAELAQFVEYLNKINDDVIVGYKKYNNGDYLLVDMKGNNNHVHIDSKANCIKLKQGAITFNFPGNTDDKFMEIIGSILKSQFNFKMLIG